MFGVSALGVRIKILHQDIWNTVQTIWIQANGLDLNLVVQETKIVLTCFLMAQQPKLYIQSSKVQHIVNGGVCQMFMLLWHQADYSKEKNVVMSKE